MPFHGVSLSGGTGLADGLCGDLTGLGGQGLDVGGKALVCTLASGQVLGRPVHVRLGDPWALLRASAPSAASSWAPMFRPVRPT
ncbi:MAG: hypothetical protein WCO77_07495 [bacterium]